ncbi:nuclear transport factor 2 family protein [Georgenia sp. EYE_87]|uniref:ester cyclase n=1 Tax=Georgenia sp. EYE_87 TaxID=2853448 RepID=UPI002005096E|nr:nuclear transport factor 2 family protein [Georgenia sp. EYE_87]MCK6212761.1 nuclear transport factor 2 family protein [Georgenia sp. EYE_87]
MTRDEMSTVGQELARRYVDTFNDRDLDAWMALFVEDAVVYDPFVPEPSRGRNAIRNVEMAVLRAFPDMRWRLLRPAVGGGGRVAVEIAVSAVNDGPLHMPAGALPATRRPISFETGTFWLLASDGLITEERSYFDATGVATQLGIGP